MPSATFNPRQRLSILTNASLGHDVSAALSLKISSNAAQQRSHVYGETAAPPPSPIDFSFAGASN
ncbi:hypothetical protein E8E13_010209 [Curvularia kusanoi]|uniref:Uncharacterized protein n=1 Tax=Curvularia kusanoi TaxID=90978 RepID=A0A9P4WD07_CURKU|nr:hypothetical protein E8E13_010209 [Curvularia kusanoi]